MDTAVLIGLLRISGKITEWEANRLQRELAGNRIPDNWWEFIRQIENIIGRNLC